MNDDLNELSRVKAGQLIRRRPVSKRSSVTEAQARLLANLIRRLESALLTHFRAPDVSRIPLSRYKDIWEIDEYQLFLDGAYACGFVCTDFKPDAPLDDVKSRAMVVVSSWDFPALRHYVHTVLRGEKWADGYSSPILEAIACGALQQVANRLESDETLYEAL